jgi:hypothetical protein
MCDLGLAGKVLVEAGRMASYLSNGGSSGLMKVRDKRPLEASNSISCFNSVMPLQMMTAHFTQKKIISTGLVDYDVDDENEEMPHSGHAANGSSSGSEEQLPQLSAPNSSCMA